MYKLIATDLDDTLLNEEGTIGIENKAAIKRAEDAGVRVIIASGRSYASTKQYIEELALPSLTISLNGAYIQDPATGRLIAGFPIAMDTSQKIMKDLEPFHVHTNFYSGEKVFCQGHSDQAKYYADMNRIEMDYVDSLVELSKTEQPGKLLLFAEPEELKPIKEILDRKYGNELNIVYSKPFFLEVTDKRASKGAALLEVARRYGIQPEEIIAMGDSENDLSMIRSAGLGIAMGNAKEKIRKAADFVTLSNGENGVAYAVNRFVFGEKQEQEVE